MELTLQIPDELVALLGDAVHAVLERRALEAFALEEYKADRISKVQLRKMLSLERIEMDGFLKSRNVFEEYTMEDFERKQRALKELGF